MAVKKKAATVALKPMAIKMFELTIEGRSPLVQHAWDQKAIKMMLDKKMGKKTKTREACDPEAEYKAAMYFTEKGEHGIPVKALKSAIITAAHRDIGIEKTLVKKALFIPCNDANKVLKMEASEPFMREDCVRVGMGSADLRYRPEFSEWKVTFKVEYDSELLTPTDIVNLIDRAGFGVGIGEMRPENGDEYGRFRVVAEG